MSSVGKRYRDLTEEELSYVRDVIGQFVHAVCSIRGIRAKDFSFEGDDADIVQLGFLFYEGVQIPLDVKTIDQACEFILANVLVINHGFRWCMVFHQNATLAYAIIHDRIRKPFVLKEIKTAIPLEYLDGDEPDISEYVRAAYEQLIYRTEWQIPPPPLQ